MKRFTVLVCLATDTLPIGQFDGVWLTGERRALLIQEDEVPRIWSGEMR